MAKKNNGDGTFVGNALRFLVKSGKTVAPEILSLAGNITGINSLNKLGSLIEGSNELTQEDKEILLAEIQRDIDAEKERTERWKADMSSDSWLSKNARPIALYNMLLMFDILMIAALFDRELMDRIIPLSVPDPYVTLFMSAFLTVLNGYFVLRTIEKRNEKKYR